MRIEIENNHTPLNEFVASLGVLREPVELMRNGAPAFTVTPHARANAGKSVAKKIKVKVKKADVDFWSFVDRARARTAELGLSNKQVQKLVDDAVRETRRKHG